jgi:hypothetical protein
VQRRRERKRPTVARYAYASDVSVAIGANRQRRVDPWRSVFGNPYFYGSVGYVHRIPSSTIRRCSALELSYPILRAFWEAMRIVPRGNRNIRPGELFPFLFPDRLVRRVLAMTPGPNTVLNRLRGKPLLPYLPMSFWLD